MRIILEGLDQSRTLIGRNLVNIGADMPGMRIESVAVANFETAAESNSRAAFSLRARWHLLRPHEGPNCCPFQPARALRHIFRGSWQQASPSDRCEFFQTPRQARYRSSLFPRRWEQYETMVSRQSPWPLAQESGIIQALRNSHDGARICDAKDAVEHWQAAQVSHTAARASPKSHVGDLVCFS